MLGHVDDTLALVELCPRVRGSLASAAAAVADRLEFGEATYLQELGLV